MENLDLLNQNIKFNLFDLTIPKGQLFCEVLFGNF